MRRFAVIIVLLLASGYALAQVPANRFGLPCETGSTNVMPLDGGGSSPITCIGGHWKRTAVTSALYTSVNQFPTCTASLANTIVTILSETSGPDIWFCNGTSWMRAGSMVTAPAVSGYLLVGTDAGWQSEVASKPCSLDGGSTCVMPGFRSGCSPTCSYDSSTSAVPCSCHQASGTVSAFCTADGGTVSLFCP